MMGVFLFPTQLVGETSKKLPNRLEQTLPVRGLLDVKAMALQGFLNLLFMDNFHAGVRIWIHMSLPSYVGYRCSSFSLAADVVSIDQERW
jgi:hypothetical protein